MPEAQREWKPARHVGGVEVTEGELVAHACPAEFAVELDANTELVEQVCFLSEDQRTAIQESDESDPDRLRTADGLTRLSDVPHDGLEPKRCACPKPCPV